MVTKKRKAHSDSAAGLQESLGSALMEIEPPKCAKLRPKDRPFWEAIIKQRAKADWPDSDLIVAVQLARCQADIETEQTTISKEKSIILNRRGSKVMNPRFFVLERLTARELSLVRTLKISHVTPHGSGKTRDVQAAREREAEFEGPLSGLSEVERDLLGLGGKGGLH